MNLLSIDLDYWNEEELNWDFLTKFLDKASVFEHHHAILKHVNKFRFENVVNVDYHSDIGDPTDGRIDFNCGTWVNFLKYRKNYTWVTSPMWGEHDGYCHVNHNPFFEKVTDFEKLEMVERVPDLVYDKVVIVLSRDYTDEHLVESFLSRWTGPINTEYPRDTPSKKIPKNARNAQAYTTRQI